MYWLEVSLTVDESLAELAAEQLRPFAPDESVVMEQMGDSADLDPDALEPDVSVKIYIAGDNDSAGLRRRIEAAVASPSSGNLFPKLVYRKLEEADWANAWKENYKPFKVGDRIWIQPSWLEIEDPDPADVMIILDPGMAFGTGTHETTQLCLMALERYLIEGARVLDVGTGSGILAIAAAKLGAADITALDTDRHAVSATAENSRLNQVDSKIQVLKGTLAEAGLERGQWDMVMVNILASVIIPILEQEALIDYPAQGGLLVLSGIINEQIEAVETAVQKAGGIVSERLTMGDWVAIVVKRGQ